MGRIFSKNYCRAAFFAVAEVIVVVGERYGQYSCYNIRDNVDQLDVQVSKMK
jgi:hypothetical protein